MLLVVLSRLLALESAISGTRLHRLVSHIAQVDPPHAVVQIYQHIYKSRSVLMCRT